MATNANVKNPAAVALGRRGGKKGGPARAAKLTPEQRSESARRAVQTRWAKSKGGDSVVLQRKDVGGKKLGQFRQEEPRDAAPAADVVGTPTKALHRCLKQIKEAKNETEIRRLTKELQRIVFHRQYEQ
jgi:hypothetical protein